MTKSKLMSENNEKDWPLWEVFYQPKNGKPYEHAGSLHASDAENALQNARDVYARRNEGIGIWVVPSDQITASTPEDMGSFFDPAVQTSTILQCTKSRKEKKLIR